MRLEVSSRLVMAQQVDLHKRFVERFSRFQFLRHKVPFAIDASDFIFLGNIKSGCFVFGLFVVLFSDQRGSF